VTLKAQNGTKHTFDCKSKMKLAGSDLKYILPYYNEVAAVNPALEKAKNEGGLRRAALIILRHKCGM
jgi:hypothetical protein